MYDNAPRDLPLVDVLTRVYIGQASIRADRMSHRRPETGDKGEREGGGAHEIGRNRMGSSLDCRDCREFR